MKTTKKLTEMFNPKKQEITEVYMLGDVLFLGDVFCKDVETLTKVMFQLF